MLTDSPKTRKGRETRETLMKAARRVLGVKGYTNARVTDMTALAGMSNGAFYRYFTDKRDVLITLLDDLFEDMNTFARSPWEPGDPCRSVQLATLEYFSIYKRNADLYRVLIEASQTETDIEHRWNEARTDFFRRIARSMRRGRDQGLIRREIDPDTAAALLGGMTEHYAYLAFVLDRVGKTDIEELTNQLVTIWSHGVFVDRTDGTEGRLS